MPRDEPMEVVIRIRLTVREYNRLYDMARAMGLTLSGLVRMALMFKTGALRRFLEGQT